MHRSATCTHGPGCAWGTSRRPREAGVEGRGTSDVSVAVQRLVERAICTRVRHCTADQLSSIPQQQGRAATRSEPGAVAAAKALARRLGPRIDEGTIAITIDALTDRWNTEEAAEGIGAFFDKRKADWMQ